MAEWDAHRFRYVADFRRRPGAKGSIELAEDCANSRLVAVKVMPASWVCDSHEALWATYLDETQQPWCAFLTSCGCLSRVLEYVGLYHRWDGDSRQVCMVLSYCSGSDLFSWLNQQRIATRADTENALAPLMHRVFLAVHDLHDQGLAHGDLSLENILLISLTHSEPPAVCVTGSEASARGGAIAVRGKARCQAPEVHLGDEYDAQLADMFSLGVMVFVSVVGDYPWMSTRVHHCPRFAYATRRGIRALLSRQKVKGENGAAAPLISHLSPPLTELLIGLLSPDPNSRCDMATALKSPWLPHSKQEALAGSAAAQ